MIYVMIGLVAGVAVIGAVLWALCMAGDLQRILKAIVSQTGD